MTEQAKKFGAERVSDVIKSVELNGDVKKLVGNKGEYEAKCVIIATGAFPKPIGCENEGKFTGKGISFCATCDASFFEDFEVYVVGGGGCLIRNFVDYDASRVIINEDICATAKGYEYMALVTLNRNGGVV